MDANTFGQRVRAYRKKRGWEQRDLARKIQKSAPTISRLENGEQEPNLAILRALADAFDISLEQLVGDHADEDDDDPGAHPSGELTALERELTTLAQACWLACNRIRAMQEKYAGARPSVASLLRAHFAADSPPVHDGSRALVEVSSL